MNGKLIRSRPLYVAFAQRKEDRRNKLQVNFVSPLVFVLAYQIVDYKLVDISCATFHVLVRNSIQ